MTLPTVLVTGGTGYIGSHTVVELLMSTSYNVVIVDNLVNSDSEVLSGIQKITGQSVSFYQCDLTNKTQLMKIFKEHSIFCVIHFAGLKAVGESVQVPILYYKNNLGCLFSLLEVMEEAGVYNIVFSSSATVYGEPSYLPLDEKHSVGNCINPYGRTKYFQELLLEDVAKAKSDWNIVILRYFNPAGAHPSGLIGEKPHGVPNNLMPYVSDVAANKRPYVNVYGNDYQTKDGTGMRDYIHVVDLALGHVAALKIINSDCGLKIYNLGTGKAYSVLEVIEAYEHASKKKIDFKVTKRREGDTAEIYADASKAKKELGWSTERDLQDMCEDAWRYISNTCSEMN